ncbi:8294_t:CDS:2 [Entrophospora sp. SA101]|nr:8294_t:CDS:2 [Entrophospora sp. SA101]
MIGSVIIIPPTPPNKLKKLQYSISEHYVSKDFESPTINNELLARVNETFILLKSLKNPILFAIL